MRTCALVLVAFCVALGLPAQAQPRAEPTPRPYEGLWGADGTAACRDEDGVNRMEITGKRLFWYETRCRALSIEAQGRRSWTMRLSCEGEGQRFRARPRLSLPAPDRLVMENAPVGPAKRQVYLRCPGTASPGRR
jgi:hypothetical protein